MKPAFVLIFGILTVLLSLGGCSGDQDRSTAETETDDTLRPDTDISGATLYMYDRDRITAEIRAERIRRFDNIDSTMGYNLDIDMFDSANVAVSQLVGDSGLIREQTNDLHVYGNVLLIVKENDTRLKTDSLYYDPVTAHVRTDEFVEITRGTSRVTGWGLDADRRLDTLKILRTVSGRITDLPETE
jgi:LPS export ABC transporter protein LptC